MGASGIYDYEVGLASTKSTTPDKMTFTSSHKHQHTRIHYPNIWNGDEFYIVVKITAKSSQSNTQASKFISEPRHSSLMSYAQQRLHLTCIAGSSDQGLDFFRLYELEFS